MIELAWKVRKQRIGAQTKPFAGGQQKELRFVSVVVRKRWTGRPLRLTGLRKEVGVRTCLLPSIFTKKHNILLMDWVGIGINLK